MTKRAYDSLCALGFLVVCSPVLLAVILLVRLKLGSPVLFTQARPGLHARPFWMVKFRTMTDGTDIHGRPRPDAERFTRFGRFLRSTSLDEVPELWNALAGDMSLVGPRPLPMESLPHYTAEQARGYDVRPGVTGWVQVNGRNAVSGEDKSALDVWYADNQSLWLDPMILCARW